MERGNRLKKLRVVMMALTGMICVRAFLWYADFILASGSNVAEAAEREKETDLLEITWEDYWSGREMEPVVLHFSFRDGAVIDQEVPYYPSIVEKTEYRDITGDGSDEVLVYRYFANTATEYTLVDIFEIKDGAVYRISPETELEELDDHVWDMTLIEDFAAGDTDYVFKMKSYDKENGMVFPDETMYIVYEESGWQILRQVSWEVRHAVWKVKDIVGKESFYGR